MTKRDFDTPVKENTTVQYIVAILKEINEDFEKDFNLYYCCNLTYKINSPYLEKKDFFYGSLEEVRDFVEHLRDMFYNKDHIYFMKSLLNAYN